MPRSTQRLLNLASWVALAAPCLSGVNQERTTDGCQLQAIEGTCRVVTQQGGPRLLLEGSHDRDLPSRGHLEVPAGSKARLTWVGQASLNIWGPTALDWAPRQTHEGTSSGVIWTLYEVARTNLEVRRGQHLVVVPGGWLVQPGSSTLHLEGSGSGAINLRNGAGRPARLVYMGDPRRARPPLSILAGSTIRLDGPLPGRTGSTMGAQPWRDTAWPWRGTLAKGSHRGHGDREGWYTESSRALSSQRPAPSSGPAATQPLTSKDQISSAMLEGWAPLEDQEGTEPTPAPRIAQPHGGWVPPHPADEASRPYRFNPEHWRGLDRTELAIPTEIGVQRRTDVEVRALTLGRTKVLVSSSSTEGAWCFTQEHDWYLWPGTVAVFEQGGELSSCEGAKARFAKVQARPAPRVLRVDRPGTPSRD